MQGLLWRIYDYVTISWITLNLHKGFLQSLLGVSNKYTRSIYKSVPYLNGCLQKILNAVQDTEKKEYIATTTAKEQIKYLLQCQWCER